MNVRNNATARPMTATTVAERENQNAVLILTSATSAAFSRADTVFCSCVANSLMCVAFCEYWVRHDYTTPAGKRWMGPNQWGLVSMAMARIAYELTGNEAHARETERACREDGCDRATARAGRYFRECFPGEPHRAVRLFSGYHYEVVEQLEALFETWPERADDWRRILRDFWKWDVSTGFDKDGLGLNTWGAMGFGYAEIGTVTALPQPGNPEPRLFRLPQDRGLLNRMGFNNAGAGALALRLARHTPDVPIGVNIGKSKITPPERAAEDYASSARLLGPLAAYLVVNVSSPNTPGLRDLQAVESLRPILRG